MLCKTWFRYYALAAFVIFSLNIANGICYLFLVAFTLTDRKFDLQFGPTVNLVRINGRMIFCAVCIIPLSIFLAYRIKKTSEFAKNDVYGLTGCLLGLFLLSLLNLSELLQYLLQNRFPEQPSPWKVNNQLDTFETMRWDSFSFSKALFDGVEGLVTRDSKYVLSIMKEGVLWNVSFYNNSYGFRLRNGTIRLGHRIPLPSGGNFVESKRGYYGVRSWTHVIQHDMRCCGVFNFTEWTKFKGDLYPKSFNEDYKTRFGLYPPSCYCNYECPDAKIPYYETCFNHCGHSSDDEVLKVLESRKGCYQIYKNSLESAYVESIIHIFFLTALTFATIIVLLISYYAVKCKRGQESRNLSNSSEFQRHQSRVDPLYGNWMPKKVYGERPLVRHILNYNVNDSNLSRRRGAVVASET